MTLVAILTVRAAKLEDFRTYEYGAAKIMADYGGVIQRTVITPVDEDGNLKEIHIVTFPNAEAFHAYRGDNRLARIAFLCRNSVITTEILIGEDGPDYSPPPPASAPRN